MDKTIIFPCFMEDFMKKYCVFVLVLSVLGNFIYAQNNAPVSASVSGSEIVSIPITTSIIQEVGAGSTAKFQYYISKAFNLKLVLERNESRIEGGQLIRKSRTAREHVNISENLPGLLRRLQIRGNNGYQLSLAFEEYEGNPVVSFGIHRSGENEKYYILFHDNTRHIIRYGNDEYFVSYDGDEPPYILIKMQESSEEVDLSRKASGLLLGE